MDNKVILHLVVGAIDFEIYPGIKTFIENFSVKRYVSSPVFRLPGKIIDVSSQLCFRYDLNVPARTVGFDGEGKATNFLLLVTVSRLIYAGIWLLGFKLGFFLFFLVFLKFVGRVGLLMTILLSLSSILIMFMFERFLGVYWPPSVLEQYIELPFF